MSALYSIEDLLRPQVILEAYQKVSDINLQEPFYQMYSAKAPDQIYGRIAEFVVFADSRKMAPLNRRGGSAKVLDAEGGTKRYLSLLHSFNKIEFLGESFEFLRQADNQMMQNKGMEEYARQLKMFAEKNAIQKKVVMAHAFRGQIYLDQNDMVQETSSSAQRTVSTGIGATHKSQLAHASNGYSAIIDVPWDNPAAKIMSQHLPKIRVANNYDKVPKSRHIWLHTANKSWIVMNDEVQLFLHCNTAEQKKNLEMLVSQQDTLVVGDWTFHFTDCNYIGADGSTNRPIVPTTAAIITPDVNDGDWFANLNGSEIVPKSSGLIQSLDGALKDTEQVFGPFAYSAIGYDPFNVAAFVGDNYMYAFKEPDAAFFATVDF